MGLVCLQEPHRRPPNGKRLSNRESLRSQHLTGKVSLSPTTFSPSSIGCPQEITHHALPCCGPPGCASASPGLRSFGPSLRHHRCRLVARREHSAGLLRSPSGKLEKSSSDALENPNADGNACAICRRMTSPSLFVSPTRASRLTSSTLLLTLWRPPRRS